MRKLIALLLVLATSWIGPVTFAQAPTTIANRALATSTVLNSNFSGLYTGRVGRWTGSGPPGNYPYSLSGDLYFDTSNEGTIYGCYQTPCTTVAAGNWVAIAGGGGGGGSSAFNDITSGTNSSATMTCGSGCTLAYAGTGVVNANKILGTTLTTLTGPIKFTAGIPSVAVYGDITGLWSGTCNSGTYLRGDGTCNSPAGAGTVTSVAGAATGIFSITGGPITGSGTLTLAQTGTSGGIAYFSDTATLSSSALLAQNQLILGGGAGAAPATLGSLGTTSTVLHGNAGGGPSFSQVVNADIATATIDLTAKVTGVLPSANGGTATALFAVSGLSTSVKTFTFPNASATVLTTNSAVTVPQGGTGLAVGTSGGIPYFSSTTTMASSGLLTANGVLYGGGAGASPGSTSAGTSGQVLTSNGSGSPPTFQTPASGGSVTSVAQSFTGGLISVNGSPITVSGTLDMTVAGTSGGIVYFSSASAWASTAALTANGVLYGGGAGGAPAATAVGSAGQVLTSNGAGNAPTFQTVTGTGTVTSVATTGPISGGTITNTGTISCPTCVTSAASLTSTAIMTGAGSQASQTACATCTLSSGGDMSLPGTLAVGVGSGVGGAVDMTAGTAPAVGSNVFGWGVGTTMTTSVRLVSPNAVPSANNVMLFGAPSSNVATWTWTGISGTGSFCMTTSCSMTTPALGTPSAAVLTNATGLPVSTGISGLGTGIATWLATPSSANLASALTDETGSGAAMFGTTPTMSTPVINGLATGTGVSAAATASVLATRDSNANLLANNFLQGYTTTATAAGTTTLTVASTQLQYFTGSTTQTVTLPVTSTMALGQEFEIHNNSTGAVTVNSSGGNAVKILAAGTAATFKVILTSGTTASSWDSFYWGSIITSGKSLSVSNTLTLAGTDGTTMTFPSTSATIARTDAANTFTGTQTFSTPIALTSLASTVVNATSPGAGIAHFAGSTQTVTSSAIVSADMNITTTSCSGPQVVTAISSGGVGTCSAPILTQNSQSAAYTTVLGDAGKMIYHPSADTTARTWTIDSNANVAYTIGTCITFVNDTSAGTLTIAITSDTMILAGAGTTGSRTLAASGIATACKMTSTRWIINGTGLT